MAGSAGQGDPGKPHLLYTQRKAVFVCAEVTVVTEPHRRAVDRKPRESALLLATETGAVGADFFQGGCDIVYKVGGKPLDKDS